MYEALLLVAVLFAAALVYVLIEAGIGFSQGRTAFQSYLFLIAGGYFCWHWTHGQTLPMKTWRIRLVTRSGAPVGFGRALLRYAAAVLGTIPCGVTFAWALADADGQFLHDRVAGTRLVSA